MSNSIRHQEKKRSRARQKGKENKIKSRAYMDIKTRVKEALTPGNKRK